VRVTCNSTTYPDLFVSALSADPSTATADVQGLSAATKVHLSALSDAFSFYSFIEYTDLRLASI
jgi:hypothetical protein